MVSTQPPATWWKRWGEVMTPDELAALTAVMTPAQLVGYIAPAMVAGLMLGFLLVVLASFRP